MKHCLTYVILWVLVGGCNFKTLELSPTEYLISTDANTTFERKIEGCYLQYEIQSLYGALEPNSQRSAIKTAFSLWQTAHSVVQFDEKITKADIVIKFAVPPGGYNVQQEVVGLVGIQRPELSAFRTENGVRVIYLTPSPTSPWTPPQITRVVAYHIGQILGLLNSDDPTSIMNPSVGNSPNSQLNMDDIAKFQKLYPNPCTDYWIYKGRIPSEVMNASEGFTIGNKGYTVEIESSFFDRNRNNINVWEFDNQTLKWQPLRSLTIQSANNSPESYLTTFMVNGMIYAGVLGQLWNEDPQIGVFYMFDPTKNQWTQIQNFPFVFSQSVRGSLSISGNTSALLIINAPDPSNIRVSNIVYRFQTSAWQRISSIPTPTFADLNESVGLSIRNQPYVFFIREGSIVAYDERSNTWQAPSPPFRSKFNYNSSYYFGFTDGGSGFVGSYFESWDNTTVLKQFWKYNSNSGFTELKDWPTKTAPSYGFYLNKRFYVVMLDGSLYEYLPK